MRKLKPIVGLLLTTATITSAEVPAVPPYYTTSGVVQTTPSVDGGAAGGMFNPAAWGLLAQPELQFFWNDLDKLQPLDRSISLGVDLGGLGFGVQRWDYTDTAANPSVARRFDDYVVGFGAGDRARRFGISYGWSRGDVTTLRPRDNTLTVGFLGRPMPRLSCGAAGTFALREKDARGIVDLGVRPLATPLVTIFGDATMGSKDRFKDILWSAGATVEPLPGIVIRFKAFDGGAYTAGLSLAVGRARISSAPRFNKAGQRLYTNHSVRVGAPQQDPLTPRLMKRKAYVKMAFDGPVKYQRYMFFDQKGHTLTELLSTFEDVKNDPRVGGLAIKITEDMSGSWEMLWEVREKMKEVQAAGKKVVVFLERGGMPEYYLASVADKMMVDPETVVTMFGFNMGRTFYRNMLEKLGLGFDEWRFFTYKSANESFSRTSMSDADKEQRKAIIDGFYETLRADICQSRGIASEQFDHIVNEVGVLTADSLLAYKLADTTGRWGDIDDYIKKIEGSKKLLIGVKPFVMMKPQSRMWGEPPQIAVIYALGPCSMNDGINARRLEGVIKSARENKRIKAVVFRADSPGGDILPSDIVAAELKKTAEKKPVIISQGSVAASGGYWISMNGHKIVASPWTITGSIGVIGGWIYDEGLGAKLGLTYDNTQVGKHADLGRGIALPLIGTEIPRRNLTTEERGAMEKMIRAFYDDFLKKVAAGRKMEKDAVHAIAQGRVWTGAAGKGNGLVDELGGMEKAIAIAKEQANIKPDAKVKIREMPRKGRFDPAMFQPKLLGVKLASLDDDPEMAYIREILKASGRPLAMLPPDLMP